MLYTEAHSKPSDITITFGTVPNTSAAFVDAVDSGIVKTWITSGYTSVGGATRMLDADLSTGYYWPMVIDAYGYVPTAHTGKPIIGVWYYFSGASNSYTAKARYLDLYYWDGASWVFHKRLETSSPVLGTTSETLDISDDPMPNPTGRFRIYAGQTSWRGSASYMNAFEFRVQVVEVA